MNGKLVTELQIPEGVTSIGDCTFYDCDSLTTIVLPKTLKTVNSQAFANCPELTDVYCHAETVPLTSDDAFEKPITDYS